MPVRARDGEPQPPRTEPESGKNLTGRRRVFQIPVEEQHRKMASTPTYLESCEVALRATGRPMTSRDLATYIASNTMTKVSGATPWKTINARISAEILDSGANSVFVRVGKGLFALREWEQLQEYTAPRRTIHPTMETIAVVPRTLDSSFKCNG